MLTFAQAMAADAAAIYSGEFSEPVGFISPSGHSATVQAIVDMTYQTVDMDSGAMVQSVKPRVSLWAPAINWKLAAQQTVILRGERYIIREVEDQGDRDAAGTADGSVVLILNKAGRHRGAPAQVCVPEHDQTTVMLGITGARFQTDMFAVDGVDYVLTHNPDGALTMVYLDGVLQPATEYTIAGSDLTLAGDVDLTAIETVTAVYSY